MNGSISILRDLQSEKGLVLAAPSNKTGYNKAWLRDNIYVSLGLELFDMEASISIVHRFFEILLKHEYKIDWAIKEKPKYSYQYIHARYNPETLEEYFDEWGNKQNDAVGAFLFRVADLINKKKKIIRNEDDVRIIKKLIDYLENIEYWHDKDNGVWEESEEVHASSIGACLAGLKAISKHFYVKPYLIDRGMEALNKLVPKESESKKVDLALLSLIYPYNIVNLEQAKNIIRNVEKKLVRKRGVIRYLGDKYYNVNGEAEWTMGFPWLSIIFRIIGNKKKSLIYLKKTVKCMNQNGELPELYFANSKEHNENTPLSWAQSLYIVASMS